MGERRTRRLVALAGLAVALALAATYVPVGFFTVRPGPVRSLRDLAVVEGYPQPEGSFFMVVVLAREATAVDLARAFLDPAVAVWSGEAVHRGLSSEEYVEESRALMAQSQETAKYLAFRESGFRVDPGGTLPAAVQVGSGEAMGPSAGLAFALELISTLRGVDLTCGRKVAATGMLGPDGEIMAVGGIAQKAAACSLEGVDLFLVPAGLEEEARQFAGTVKVVGVRSLASAVRYLGGEDIP